MERDGRSVCSVSYTSDSIRTAFIAGPRARRYRANSMLAHRSSQIAEMGKKYKELALLT